MEKCVQWVWRLQIMSTNLSYNAEITTIKSTQYIALTTFSTWTRVTGCHAAFPSPPVWDGSHASRKGRQEFFICCLAPTNHVFVGHLQCTMFSPVHNQYLRFKAVFRAKVGSPAPSRFSSTTCSERELLILTLNWHKFWTCWMPTRQLTDWLN